MLARIVGDGYGGERLRQQGGEGLSYVEQRLKGAWHVLFAGNEITSRSASLVGAALCVAVLIGFTLRLRRPPATVVVLVTTVAVLVLYHLRFTENRWESATGLLAAWPVALVALLACPWKKMTAPEWMLALLVLLFTGAVLATQYPIGGGLEWGGRFLTPAIVPLAVLITMGLFRRLRDRAAWQRVLCGIALAALAFYPSLRGVDMLREYRAAKGQLYAEIGERATPLIVLDESSLWYLPSQAWRLDPAHQWMTTYNQAEAKVLPLLYEHGFDRVTVIRAARLGKLEGGSYSVVRDVTGPYTAGSGLAMYVVERGASPSFT
jgi:hypothetical protein